MSKVTLGICSDWLNGKGILKVLTDNFNVPWKNSLDGQVLDDDYYGNRSSNKLVSPLVEKFLNENGLSDSNMLRLARVIYAKYGEGWNRAALALAEEYNPIENYNRIEEDVFDGGKRKTARSKGEQNNKETYGQYTETKGNQTDTNRDYEHTDESTIGEREGYNKGQVEGFNSIDFSDANKDIQHNNEAKDTTKYGEHIITNEQGQRVDSYSQKVNDFKDGARTDSEESDAYTDERNIHSHGNIGVTTTIQMLTEEMDFRKIYTLFDTVVFPNVDAVMCLNIFGCEDLTMDDFTIITDYILPKASANVLGGVKIGNGITISDDGTISVDFGNYVTTEQLTTTLQDYVTSLDLETILADYPNNNALANALTNYYTKANIDTTLESYYTKTEVNNGLATKQDTLISGTNIKTINGESILGQGNIEIKGGGGYATLQINDVVQSLQLTPVFSVEVEVQ